MGRNQGPQSGGYGSLHPQLHADQLGDDTSTRDMLPISPETKKKKSSGDKCIPGP